MLKLKNIISMIINALRFNASSMTVIVFDKKNWLPLNKMNMFC